MQGLSGIAPQMASRIFHAKILTLRKVLFLIALSVLAKRTIRSLFGLKIEECQTRLSLSQTGGKQLELALTTSR